MRDFFRNHDEDESCGRGGRFRHGHGRGREQFGFFGGRGGPFGARWRMRRGFIRIALLRLLDEQPRHGYELIQTFKERGWGTPGPGSIYPVLMMMDEHGLVTSTEQDGKRVYTITDEGRAVLEEHASRFEDLFEGGDVEEQASPEAQLRAAAERLMHAVAQAAHSSNEQTVSRTREILDAARKEIYTLLAQE